MFSTSLRKVSHSGAGSIDKLYSIFNFLVVLIEGRACVSISLLPKLLTLQRADFTDPRNQHLSVKFRETIQLWNCKPVLNLKPFPTSSFIWNQLRVISSVFGIQAGPITHVVI